MTYELVYYLFMVLIGALFCIIKIPSERLYFFITLFLLCIYSSIIRYSGFDGDMNAYEVALKSESFSLYYLKEPVYWMTSRYIYKITQSEEITFIIFDILSFIFVLKARTNMKLPQYFPYLFLLFFPAVMGMNNVFRQYLSYTIFLYFTSLLLVGSGFIKKSFFILISILTHNVGALFSPLFFTFNEKRHISIKSVFSYLCVLTLLPFVLGTKSYSDSGMLGVGVYLFVMLMLLIFYILSYRNRLNDISAKFLYYFIYLISLTSLAALLMGSAQSKRVGMFALMIILVPVVKAIEDNYKQKMFVRVTLYIMLITPTILFPSSLIMLLTQVNS